MQSHLCVSFLRSRLHNGTLISLSDCNAVASDFTFPEDAPAGMPSGRRWSSGSRSASTATWAGSHGACSNACSPSGPPPSGCIEAYFLQRTRFESIAERKLRRRQLTKDGNVEISGRDLGEGSGQANTRETSTRDRTASCNSLRVAKHRALLQGAVASHVAQGFSRYRQSY
jgi:hypothetical protein